MEVYVTVRRGDADPVMSRIQYDKIFKPTTYFDFIVSGNEELANICKAIGLHVPDDALDNYKGRDPKIIGRLLDAGAHPRSIHLFDAASRGDVDVVRVLLEHGVRHSNAVYIAASYGKEDAARLLLDKKWGLHSGFPTAIKRGRIDVVERLIAYGDDVNTPDAGPGGPLGCAILAGQAEIARLLIKHNAGPPGVVDAAKKGAGALLELLAAHGAQFAHEDISKASLKIRVVAHLIAGNAARSDERVALAREACEANKHNLLKLLLA